MTYLFVGRLTDLKGVHYLLPAWKEHLKNHPKDYLVIVGGGPMEEEFHLEYDDEASIEFTGSIDYSLIYRYYAICDVFVIPTLEDNWSLVVPEAMVSGKAIPSSIYNGCYPELVHDGENGALFDPLQKKSIIKALEVFHNVDLKQYGQNSIMIEANFSPEKTGHNIYNALKEIYNKHKNGNKK